MSPRTARKSMVGFTEPSLQAQSTPPSPTRGRMGLRYPSTLSRESSGRVPLHKRGKSRTYETMEDLLREAGYKETRIFTPEPEKTEGRTASRVGAVVGYLAGLVPGINRSDSEELSQEDTKGGELASQTWSSTPPSPLAGKHTRTLPSDPGSPKDFTTRLRTSTPGSPRFGATHGKHPFEQSLRPQPSASESLRAYAQISAAQGYLRHMASTPNITKSPRSEASDMTSARVAQRSRGRNHTREEQPPLPSGWLDSVTKAVLGSSTAGAHPGQPRPSGRAQTRPPPRMPHRTHSHLALSDHTNKVRPMGSLRSQTAPGAVNTVMVVCRSAPSSRSSSRVGERLSYVADKTRTTRRARAARKSQGQETDALPSLASTLLENDSWAPQWVDGKRVPSIAVDDYDSSDDDDRELDLAQLLLPPKRQKSIRSLRQHLHRSESARALRTPSMRALEPYILDDDEDFARRRKNISKDGRTHRWTPSDEGSGLEELDIPGIEQHGAKQRRGLPVTWSNLAPGR